ncbi:MAG: hypothetical protein ACYC7A_12735 [Thermoanaerobaculia bacterium]
MRKTVWLVVFLVASLAYAQAPQVGGPLPLPLPLFPQDNWWNVPVTNAPVDPQSANFINFIGPTRGLHPDFGGDAGPVEIYGIPYVTVPGTQPLVPVTFDYADESDTGAPGRPPGYPIPEQAKTQAKWIEGGYPATGGDGDRHMLIVDRDNRILFEIYATHWNTSLNRWEAGSGAIFPLDTNLRRPDGWTSADAAGLAILPGLIRYDEVFGPGPIEHAFRVTVRATNGYVYPASHRAGSTSGALPMGARLRLKPSTNISGYPPEVQKIFQAFKDYGLIVADNGSDMYITGTYDTRWDNGVLNPAFGDLTASDFEVIQLGWEPSSQPPCTAPSVGQQPQDATIAAGETATLAVSFSGTSPIAIQWYCGTSGNIAQPVSGATSSTVQVSPSVTTTYWARGTNACNSANSRTATVTVTTPACAAPGILQQPLSVTVDYGASAALSVHASGTAPLAYQWYRGHRGDRSNPVSDATSATLLIARVTAGGWYWVSVDNACGSLESAEARINVAGRRRPARPRR